MPFSDRFSPNFLGFNDELSLDENDQPSFNYEPRDQQEEEFQGQDLFAQERSIHFPEFDEDNQNYPKLEDLTQSLAELQDIIDDESPQAEMNRLISTLNIEPSNNEAPIQLNLGQRQTTNTSSDKDAKVAKENKTSSNRNYLLGRKRKEEKGKGEHSKYKPDNQMRKIKSYAIKFFTEQVNSSLSPGHDKFLKITPKVNENLNKDYNVNLMKNPIKNIFAENPINGRYSKEGIEKDYNKQLVEDIYEKNEETRAIEILDMTYIQHLDILRKKYLWKFKQDLIKKEKKNGETEKEANFYVNQLVSLLMDYEEWFNRKTARRPRIKNKH